MIRVLIEFGSRCKTIFCLFQAGFVHRYGNRTGYGYAESGRQVRFVDLHLYSHEISKLLSIYTEQKSNNRPLRIFEF